MPIYINALTKDTSFKDDDYLLKDGNTNKTRIISVQNAADDLARRSTIVLKRASNYDEASAITETDYIIKDNTTAPARVLASNAATSLAQMATYPDGSNVADTDYILKINANGKPQKVEASQAAADLAELAGQIAGAEMLEEAIAKGIVDQAMTNAIETTVPQAVQTLRSELSEGEVASQIVDGALTSYAADTLIANTDKFYKRDTNDTTTTYVTAKQIVDAGLAAGSSRSRNTLTTADTETGYVLDARQGRVLNENKVNKAGDTMTGNLIVQSNNSEERSFRVIMNDSDGNNIAHARLMGTPTGHIGIYNMKKGEWTVDYDPTTDKTTIPRLNWNATASGTQGSGISNWNAFWCYLRKVGNLVFITLSTSTNNTDYAISGETILATVPDAYKPAVNQNVLGVMFYVSQNLYGTYIQITPSGTIKTSSAPSNCRALFASGVYSVVG